MVGALLSAGHGRQLDRMAGGFMTGIGMSKGLKRVALIAGLADINVNTWYWRSGLEFCFDYRYGSWEWSGCLAGGVGQIREGPKKHSDYPWTSVAQSVRLDLTHGFEVRLDVGVQVSVAKPEFGFKVGGSEINYNPMVILGAQYTIPQVLK